MSSKEMEKALSFEIDNIRERDKLIISDPFSSGGCEWFLTVYPCTYPGESVLRVYLSVLNPESLRNGWQRRVRYCFVGLYQSGKQLFKLSSDEEDKVILYNSSATMWGYKTGVGRPMIQKLENNKLIIEVYINVVEVVPPVMVDFNGFQILSSQAVSVGKIYAEHPDFAVDFKPNNPGVKTAYMNLLLGLIERFETLSKSPQSFFVTELSNAQRELTDLTEAGFKLDWLNSKLEEIFLERKKSLDDGSWVEQLEERVKTLESTLPDRKFELQKNIIISEAITRLSSFDIIDVLIKRFFLSCFSVSK